MRKGKWQAGSRTRAGFTIVEMSVVLVIIAVILGAITVGNDVMRNAQGQRVFVDFVTGWQNAFANYFGVVKAVPGDDPVRPSHVIKGAGGGPVLCNEPGVPTMTNFFLEHSIALPAGWTAGQEDRYVYQDSNGSPHELRVCFRTVQWSVPGTSSGVYVTASRHVLQLTGLTSELAMQLDGMIDGKQDARFGRFRSQAESANVSMTSVQWPPVRTRSGEDDIGEVTAYLQMN